MSVSYGVSNGGSARRVKLPISEYIKQTMNILFFIVLKTLSGVNSAGVLNSTGDM